MNAMTSVKEPRLESILYGHVLCSYALTVVNVSMPYSCMQIGRNIHSGGHIKVRWHQITPAVRSIVLLCLRNATVMLSAAICCRVASTLLLVWTAYVYSLRLLDLRLGRQLYTVDSMPCLQRCRIRFTEFLTRLVRESTVLYTKLLFHSSKMW